MAEATKRRQLTLFTGLRCVGIRLFLEKRQQAAGFVPLVPPGVSNSLPAPVESNNLPQAIPECAILDFVPWLEITELVFLSRIRARDAVARERAAPHQHGRPRHDRITATDAFVDLSDFGLLRRCTKLTATHAFGGVLRCAGFAA